MKTTINPFKFNRYIGINLYRLAWIKYLLHIDRSSSNFKLRRKKRKMELKSCLVELFGDDLPQKSKRNREFHSRFRINSITCLPTINEDWKKYFEFA